MTLWTASVTAPVRTTTGYHSYITGCLADSGVTLCDALNIRHKSPADNSYDESEECSILLPLAAAHQHSTALIGTQDRTAQLSTTQHITGFSML